MTHARAARHGLGLLLMALVSTQAPAAALAMADIRLDWSSLVIAADPGLTMTPDPSAQGRFSNNAHLGVSQAQVRSVAVPGGALQPYNLSYQSVDAVRTIDYRNSDAFSQVAAQLSTGPSASTLLTTADDHDGDLFHGSYINAYVARSARYLVSGSGLLSLAFGYTMALSTAGLPGLDHADVFGRINLAIQDYEPDAQGAYTLPPRTLSSQQETRIFFDQGQTSFTRNATLTLSVPFAGASNHLLLLEMNGIGIPVANSARLPDGQVPEPTALWLVLAAIGASALARRTA